MDARDVLHWSALVTALYALAWALGQWVGVLVPLAMLLGIVAGTLLIVAARRVPETERGMYYAGAVGVLIVHVFFVLLLVGESSFTFGEDNPLAINQDPPQFVSDLKGFLATYIGGVAMALFAVAMWPLWARRDRILAGVGVGLNVLVIVLALAGVGGGAEDDATATLLPVLFAISFLPFAAAALLPVLLPDAPGGWATAETTTPAGVATPGRSASRKS